MYSNSQYKWISKTFGSLIFLKILVLLFLKKEIHNLFCWPESGVPGNLNLVFRLFRFSCEKAVLDPSNYVLFCIRAKAGFGSAQN